MSLDAVLALPSLPADLLRSLLASVLDGVTVLDDGAVLVTTAVPFCEVLDCVEERDQLVSGYASWLGDDLRGAFVYPALLAPPGRTYDEVVTWVGATGAWLATPAQG